MDGSIDKSYGINVAALAHLPKSLLERANELLNKYEMNEKNNSNLEQMSLVFEEQKNQI